MLLIRNALLSVVLLFSCACLSSDDSSDSTDRPTWNQGDTVLNNWPDNDQRYEPIPPTEGSVQLIPSEAAFYFIGPANYSPEPQLLCLCNFTYRSIIYKTAIIENSDEEDLEEYFAFEGNSPPESQELESGYCIDIYIYFKFSYGFQSANLFIFTSATSDATVVGILSGKIFNVPNE